MQHKPKRTLLSAPALPCRHWEFIPGLQELQLLPPRAWVPLVTAALPTQMQMEEQGAAAWLWRPLSSSPSARGWLTRGRRAAVPQTAVGCLTLPRHTACEHGVVQGWLRTRKQLLCWHIAHAFCCLSERTKRQFLISAEPGREYKPPSRTRGLLARAAGCCVPKAGLVHAGLSSALS